MGRFAARLYLGIQGHDIEAAEHADQKQIEHHAPATIAGQKRPRPDFSNRHIGGRGKKQIDGKDTEPDRTERHQTDFHFMTGQAFA